MAFNEFWLTIVICTRNRPHDIIKCALSIATQSITSKKSINVLIIDDGDLANPVINELREILFDYCFNYYKKEVPGLLLSRIFAIFSLNSEYILFIDDDVILEYNYLDILKKTYEQNLEIVGVSGIDLLLDFPNIFKWTYHTLFLLKSGNPGKLSLTSYGESMQYWRKKTNIFSTEFLSGCNMSFKRISLLEIKPVDWLNGYSLGEDVYLSFIARNCGKLIINPDLKVKHFQSQTSRDKIEEVAFNEIINHHNLLEMQNAESWKLLLHGWTIFGIILKTFLSLNFKKIKGYSRAVLNLIKY